MNVLFVQSPEKLSSCSVFNTWRLIMEEEGAQCFEVKRGEEQLRFIDKFYDCCSEVLGNIELDRLVVFGVRDHQWPLLTTAKSGKFLNSDWFDNLASDCIGVVLSKGGELCFREGTWADRFTQWVTLGENYDELFGSFLSEKMAKNIYQKFIEAARNYNTSEEIHLAFEEIIDEARMSLSQEMEGENRDDAITTDIRLRLNLAEIVHDAE